MENNFYYNNKIINKNNNQKTDNSSIKLTQENNKIKSPYDKYDKYLNKDSYIYLHSKKMNNINKTNNYQSLIDCPEPEPQIFPEFYQMNNKNNSFDVIQNKKDNIPSKNIKKAQIPLVNKINNNNITNRNNKKLLEEYFQLKKKNNYNTLNSVNNNKKELQYNPLNKKTKIKKNSKQNQIKNANNINYNKTYSMDKNDILQIYQPEKDMTNSPSFTPIKNKFQNKKIKKNDTNPTFAPKQKSNTKNKKTPINHSTQRREFNNKLLKSEDENINLKRIKNIKDKNKYKICNRTPITTRKNLTPSKIPGIWVESNNINYNKTYSMDKNDIICIHQTIYIVIIVIVTIFPQ